MRLALASTEGLRGEFGATLGAACRQDGTAGAGAHAKAEAVLLGAATVVRLEGTLAHSSSPAVGSPHRAAVARLWRENWVPKRAGVNLLKLRPRSPGVKPGAARTRRSANDTVSRVPRDHLWIDTRGPSNPSPGICSRGCDSLPCETSYPQLYTRNLGRLPDSAHRRWITL